MRLPLLLHVSVLGAIVFTLASASLVFPARTASTVAITTHEVPTRTVLRRETITFAPIVVTGKTILIDPITLEPKCTQTITPDSNGFVPPETCGALYKYYPSFAAALVFTVLFALLTIAHIWQAVLYKATYCWVIIMASLWETMSFLIRTISTKNQQLSGLVMVSTYLVLLAPLWINAFIYTFFTHTLTYHLPDTTILGLTPRLLLTIFLLLDVISFVVQTVGGAMAPSTAPREQALRGIHIYMGGIGMQELFILLFLGVVARLHWKLTHRPWNSETNNPGSWRTALGTIYAGLFLITIRIIYRLVEFSAGNKRVENPLPFREVYFYVLEAVPMFLALGLFDVLHPGRMLVGWQKKRRGEGLGWFGRGKASDGNSLKNLTGPEDAEER